MAAVNCAPYMEAAVKSALNQTYKNWELIIVDDGSIDLTLSVATRFAEKDIRISVVRNQQNLGVSRSLNRAIEVATGEFVARMDADDVMKSGRLELQVNFLKANPEIGIVGGAAEIIDSNERVLGRLKMPRSHTEIVWHEATKAASSFIHPTVMMRACFFRKQSFRYDEEYRSAQDKKLWFELLNVTKGANLPEVLISYRRHDSSISRTQGDLQRRNATLICTKWMERILGRTPDESAMRQLLELPRNMKEAGLEPWHLIAELLSRLQLRHDICEVDLSIIRHRLATWVIRYGTPQLWWQLYSSRVIQTVLGPVHFSRLIEAVRKR